MYRGEIPGFYFDEEKQKYFKIVANHVATSRSQYSRERVKEEQKESEKQQARNRHASAMREQLVRPARISISPTAAGICLNRELSQGASLTRTLDNRAKAYAAGLEVDWTVKARTKISTFAHDPGTGDYLVGSECGQGHFAINVYSSLKGRKPELLEAFGSPISSISLTPTRVAAVTCLGGPGTAKVVFVSLADPDLTYRRTIDYQMSVGFSFPAETTAWSSAANPFTKTESNVAIGLSNSTTLFTDVGGDWAGCGKLESTSDAMALSWLTPTVVSIGQRNGSVKLWDTRSNGSALRLQHPACITGIRRVNAENLVVCGYESALAMYDLRMPLITEGPSPSKRRKKHSNRSANTLIGITPPVMQFDHENANTASYGFDLDVEKGLVAVGDDRDGVALFSLLTGHKLGKPKNWAHPDARYRLSPDDVLKSTITDLQFVQNDVRAGDCLMASGDYGMLRMKW